jgi:hypothetical protein
LSFVWSLWSHTVTKLFKTAQCNYVAILTTEWRRSTVSVVLQLLVISKARKGVNVEYE